MPPSVTIRGGGPADARALTAIFRAAIARHGPDWFSPEQVAAWMNRRTPEDFARRLADLNEPHFVAEVGKQPVGFSAATPGAPGEITMLYVHPEAPRGTGSLLLARAEKTLRDLGVETARLVAALNAQGFYLKRGWKTVGPALCDCDGEGLPAFEMTKPLWRGESF